MSHCSVVIVSHQSSPDLFLVVGSVLAQERLAELVIVDNGNTPDILSKLQQMALSDARVRVVSAQGNLGYSKACNLGAKHTSGEFVMLLGQRCLLPPEALTRAMLAIDRTPQAVVAGGLIVYPDGSPKDLHYHRGLRPKTLLADAFGFWRKAGLAATTTHEVGAVSGACLCMRRKDYNGLLGLDEGFFVDIADYDICMRVQATGGKVLLVPDIRVTQLPKNVGRKGAAGRQWQKTKSLLRYFTKHFQRHYFPGFLLLVNAMIISRYAIVMALSALRAWSQPETAFSGTVATKRLMILASVLSQPAGPQPLQGKIVLVTGANGQLGLCVIRRLIGAGAAVLALTRSAPPAFEHKHLRWLHGDLTDQGLHLHNYLADAVVHCAPLEHLPPLIDLLADAEVKRVVAFGSTSIFGKMLSKNSYEKAIVERLEEAEKAIAQKCSARKIDWTILRPTMIYGVGLDLNITSLAKIIERFRFFPIYPPAFGRRQPVHADDLAGAVLQVLSHELTYNKAYNVSGGEVLTYRTMLERIFAVCGHKPRIRGTTLLPFLLDVYGRFSGKKHINGEIARRMNDDLVFFHDDAKRDFNYQPRAFLTGGNRDIEGF